MVRSRSVRPARRSPSRVPATVAHAEQVDAVEARSMSSAWQSRAGPAARPRVGAGGRPRRARMMSMPSTGSTARMSTAPASPSAAADDVEAMVHAVDEVDIGAAGWPEHDCRAGRAAGSGMTGAVSGPAYASVSTMRPTRRPAPIVAHQQCPQQRRAASPRSARTRAARSSRRRWHRMGRMLGGRFAARWWRQGSTEDLAHGGWQERPKHDADDGHQLLVDAGADVGASSDWYRFAVHAGPPRHRPRPLALAVERGQHDHDPGDAEHGHEDREERRRGRRGPGSG